jgi:thymidylate synthase
MAEHYLRGDTLDDLIRLVIEEIQSRGDRIIATKGPAVEITGVLLELANPRARLSRTETRGKPYSCLGELCWYLAKSNDLAFIEYYIPAYQQFADDDVIFCGYGPRLFNWDGVDQISNVTSLLRSKHTSRKAVIQLFDRRDIIGEHKDVSCTCTLQLMVRREALHMITYMRSNDVFLGLPHDIFCFTMLQEIIARTIAVEVGTYKHAVGSLHLYEINTAAASQFMAEGWQTTLTVMPPMPKGDPWPNIDILLEIESIIRNGNRFNLEKLRNMEAYWADLIRLLQVFRCKKDNLLSQIEQLRAKMSCSVYNTFIDKVANQLNRKEP